MEKAKIMKYSKYEDGRYLLVEANHNGYANIKLVLFCDRPWECSCNTLLTIWCRIEIRDILVRT